MPEWAETACDTNWGCRPPQTSPPNCGVTSAKSEATPQLSGFHGGLLSLIFWRKQVYCFCYFGSVERIKGAIFKRLNLGKFFFLLKSLRMPNSTYVCMKLFTLLETNTGKNTKMFTNDSMGNNNKNTWRVNLCKATLQNYSFWNKPIVQEGVSVYIFIVSFKAGFIENLCLRIQSAAICDF